VRLAQKGRVSDDRERSKCSMVTGGIWGNMDIYFGDSLELTVVFKCSMVTGGVWGTWIYIFGGSLGLMVVFKCLDV